MDKTICVYDFCGYTSPGHFPIQMWGDYNPTTGITIFGGDWYDIPDMYTDHEPSEDECSKWAKDHGSDI